MFFKKFFIFLFFVLFFSLFLGFFLGETIDNTANFENKERGICVYVFYSEYCPHCANLYSFLQQNQDLYNIEIHAFKVRENAQLFRKYLEVYEVPEYDWGKVPTMFFSDSYCLGDTPCMAAFLEKVGEPGEIDTSCPSLEKEKPVLPGKEEHRKSLSFLGITGLALVDAINPCALAVLVILLTTILLRFPKQKRKVLFSGFSFSFAIFLLYFVMGILIVLGFKSVTGLTSLGGIWLYKLLGVFAILIGLLNIKDYFRYGKGFLMEVPVSWRPNMRKIIESTTSPLGAFFVGVVVSLFLLPCTAGPYFVAGGILSGVSWSAAIPWLFYYNFLFILPMLVITLLIYMGFAAIERVSEWREQHLRTLHLFAGIVLVVLGIILILGLI